MLPVDPNRAPLPDPIPASLYARPAGPAGSRPAGRRRSEPGRWWRLVAEARGWPNWWRLVAEARGWPTWKQVLVAAGCAAGLVLLVLSPWRPALALLAVVVPAAVILGVDAWGLRRRAPVLGSPNELIAAGGWAVVAGLLLLGALLAVPGRGGAPADRPDSGLAAAPGRTAPAPGSSPTVPVALPPSASPSATPRPSPTPSLRPSPTPTSDVITITLLDAPLSVSRPGFATLRAQTAPLTQCSLSAIYRSGPRALGATSDGGGAVSWSWRVGPQAPAGTWQVTVACGSATASTQITVS